MQNVELSVVTRGTLTDFTYPTPYEFHYSDDYKSAFIKGTVDFGLGKTDRDLAGHFVIAKKHGVTLIGEPAQDIFPTVPIQHYLGSIARDSKWSFDNIMNGSDEGMCRVPNYAVLNFCRVLAFIKDNLVTSKKTGGEWALNNLPKKIHLVVQEALNEYKEQGSSQAVDCGVLKKFAMFSNEIIRERLSQL